MYIYQIFKNLSNNSNINCHVLCLFQYEGFSKQSKVKHTCVFFLYILKLPSQIIMYSSQRSLSTIERKET